MTLQAKQPQSVKLHRIKNAALLLGVSKPTIYRLVRAGELTLVKLESRLRERSAGNPYCV